MESERFELKNAANTVGMAPCTSKVLQIATVAIEREREREREKERERESTEIGQNGIVNQK